MALKVGELYGELTLNATAFRAGLAEAEGQTTASGLKMGAVMGVAMQAVQMAMTEIVGTLQKAREAFLANETSVANLGQMLLNNVPGWDGNTKAIEEYVKAQAEMGFTANEVRDSLGKLVGVTHDVNEAVKLEGLAEDLARAKHLDLTVATKDVTLASEGVGRALKGLGVDIVGLVGGAAMLDALQKNVTGSASEWAATDEGKLAIANAHVTESMVKMGEILTKILAAVLPPLVAALSAVADVIQFVGEHAAVLTPILGALALIVAAAVVPALWSAAAAAAAVALSTIEVWGLTVALVTIFVAIGAAIVNFADKLGILKPILDVVGFVAKALAMDLEMIVGTVERIISVLTHLDGSADTSAQSMDNVGQSAQGASTDLSGLSDQADATGDAVTGLATTTTAAMGTARSATWGAAYEVGGALKSILAGYDELGNKIMMTVPDFLAFQNASRSAANGAAQDMQTMMAAAAQAASMGNFGQSYTDSSGMVFGSTNVPGGYNTTTGQPNTVPTYAEGGFVPGSGPRLAIVHGGENVQTPEQLAAEAKRQGVNLTVNNPAPEPASTSVGRELQKLAAMGFLEPSGVTS